MDVPTEARVYTALVFEYRVEFNDDELVRAGVQSNEQLG
jgi:hypothetical protein